MARNAKRMCSGLICASLLLGFMWSQAGAQVSWWEPEDPNPGDIVTIYYNDYPGTLPDNGSSAKLHWGINETSHGGWQKPPQSMWPAGSVAWSDNVAVQSPMQKVSAGLWSIHIDTDLNTETIHYVVTNGTNWDNNSNANWDIALVELPPVLVADVQFVLDTRSALFGFDPDDITTVNLAGTFNSWSTTSDVMAGPDERGTYSTTRSLGEGYYEYKFVVNHDTWFWDPDNPNNNPNDNNNSILIVVADTFPSFEDIVPQDGQILFDLSDVSVTATVVDGDHHDGIDASSLELALDGNQLPFFYDPAQYLLTGFASLLGTGRHVLAFDVSDMAGRSGPPQTSVFGLYPSDSGYWYLDSQGDDTGPGSYVYPEGVASGAADLLSLHIELAEDGDSLRFQIGLADITDETIVSFILANAIDASLVDDVLGTELRIVSWSGRGIYVPLISPASPHFDVDMHNSIYTNHDPLTSFAQLGLDGEPAQSNTFAFSLSLNDLTDIFGTLTSTWQCCIHSCLTGVGDVEDGVMELVPETGGIDDCSEPDVYDLMFCDSPWLQKRLLANYTSSRLAALDNDGRGYGGINTTQIDSSLEGSDISLTFLTKGGTTLKKNVAVVGTVSDPSIPEVTMFHNGAPTTVPVVQGKFTSLEFLVAGENIFQVLAESDGDSVYSSNLIFYRKFYEEPQIMFSSATFSNGLVTLNASGSTDPDGPRVFFAWTPDPDNPAGVILDNSSSATPSFAKPEIAGEYFFDLVASDVEGLESAGRTLVTVTADSAWGSGMNDSPQWVKDAILYEIFIRSFSASRDFAGATAMLPDLVDLGVTAIWLMPINEGPSDHGYAVNDYYAIESDYGTLSDFQEFIDTAHELGLRVIIDHVVNHSSSDHPFFQDMDRNLEYSFYYDFYERREELGGTLSPDGLYTYYYDWSSLPNLNESDVDAEDYLINMAKFYTDSLDVDGFRCDVAWGVQDRYPEYWQKWRMALKTTKPDILCLAEAGATDFVYFDERFDSAYDWPLFWDGFGSILRGGSVTYLHEKIRNEFGGTVYGFPSNAYPLRFLENHDEERYMVSHTVPQTKIMATLLLTIPGMPLIYAGQEVGETSQRGLINWSDPNGLRPYFQKLISIRNTYPALRNQEITRLENGNSNCVYSFYRQEEDEIVLVNLNFANEQRPVELRLPVAEWDVDVQKQYYLTDVLNGVLYPVKGADLDTVRFNLGAYQAQILVLSDSPGPEFWMKGDVNGDQVINVLDVVKAVNIILDLPPTPTEYERWTADFNSDEVVNVLDVVAMVNKILE